MVVSPLRQEGHDFGEHGSVEKFLRLLEVGLEQITLAIMYKSILKYCTDSSSNASNYGVDP